MSVKLENVKIKELMWLNELSDEGDTDFIFLISADVNVASSKETLERLRYTKEELSDPVFLIREVLPYFCLSMDGEQFHEAKKQGFKELDFDTYFAEVCSDNIEDLESPELDSFEKQKVMDLICEHFQADGSK